MDFRTKKREEQRVLAQWRRFWEPRDTSRFTRDSELVVSSALKDLGLNERFDEEKVFEAWNSLVDGFVAKNARPVSVNRKVLHIQVLHSTIYYELERMKGEILRVMQEKFGKDNIREIRFRLG